MENGTFTGAEGFTKSVNAIKSEYRKYRNSNAMLSRETTNNRDDKLSVGFRRTEEGNNTTSTIKQNSRNESITTQNSQNEASFS